MSVVNVKKAFLNERGYKDYEDWAKDPGHVYIGRNMSFYVKGTNKSKWANPFSVKKYGREGCLEKYEEYIRNSELMDQLHELKGKELGCWCHPEACHGDILLKLMNSAKKTMIREKTLYYKLPERVTERAIAFDLDWTLAHGQEHLYPKNPDDIHVLPGRKKKLKSLYKKGYTLLIFTNQFGKGKTTAAKVQRVETFLSKIGVDMGVFIATGKDEFRKPEQGMMEKCRELLPDTTIEYYVGDALGRPQDFSDSDKEFAERAGIKYTPPEKVFRPKLPKIDTGKQLIIFIGAPGTGKSSFFRQHLKPLGYVQANQDMLKTDAKVKKLVVSSMKAEKDICLDRTNGKPEQRNPYVKLAEENGYTVRYFYFVRDGHGWNKTREKPVPDIVYHMFFKNLQLPENIEKIA